MTVALWEFENGALDPTMMTNSEIRAVKFSLDRMLASHAHASASAAPCVRCG